MTQWRQEAGRKVLNERDSLAKVIEKENEWAGRNTLKGTITVGNKRKKTLVRTLITEGKVIKKFKMRN